MSLKENDSSEQNEQIDLNQIVADEAAAQNETDLQGDDQDELSPVEQKAFDQGWRPQEEFKGPEENWKTPKEFIRDGEWLAKLKEKDQRLDRIERDFNDRLENTNKLHEVRRQTEITKLKSEQRNAVDMADTDAYDAAGKQIAELEKESQPVPQQPAKAASVAEWETNNPWINDANDERTPVTQAIWGRYLQQNPNATPEQALAHVDDRISKLYPTAESNPRREQPNTTETPRKASRQKGKAITMNDLTNDERQEWNQYGSMMFKTETAFLKAVTDARKK